MHNTLIIEFLTNLHRICREEDVHPVSDMLLLLFIVTVETVVDVGDPVLHERTRVIAARQVVNALRVRVQDLPRLLRERAQIHMRRAVFRSWRQDTLEHFKMNLISVMLSNQIPFVMAPAAIIASILVFSIVATFYRVITPGTRAMVYSVMLALSGYALMMLSA